MSKGNVLTGYAWGDQGQRGVAGPNECPSEQPVPGDLRHYYRNTHRGWAYICPHCRLVFDPEWAGMPGSFRGHLADEVAAKNKKDAAEQEEGQRKGSKGLFGAKDCISK